MVTKRDDLHPIERLIADELGAGRVPQLETIGGIGALFDAEDELAASRFLPEVLSVVASNSPPSVPTNWYHFILKLMNGASEGPTVQSCIDVIDASRSLLNTHSRALFDLYAGRANDVSLDSLARTAFLEGCVRLAIRDETRRHSLLALFIDFDSSTLGLLCKRFVKVLGVINCHWGTTETQRLLTEHLEDSNCVDEANLELGFHYFGRMLNAVDISRDPRVARADLESAEQYFLTASQYASVRAESHLYRLACRIIRDFSDGVLSASASQIADELDRGITALQAYHRSKSDPSWLGARTSELLFWRTFSAQLRTVDSEIIRASWYEPKELIVSSLVPVFTASRTLLARNEAGGVEVLTQPRIVSTLAANPAHIDNLRRWLERNDDHRFAVDVSNLLDRIETEVGSGTPRTLIWGQTNRNDALAIFAEDPSSSEPETVAARVYYSAASLHLRHLKDVHFKIIHECVEAVSRHPDYQNRDIRQLFDATLLSIVRFVDSRLNLTKRDEPGVAYLFRRSDKTRAKEEELQKDFVATFSPFAVGTEIEVTNVGGGRADIYLTCNAERMTCEVKRDHVDCTFEKLVEKYFDQTIQYQNSSARIGFMLVLDQTNRGGKALHIADSIHAMQLKLPDESEPRHVIVCLVSGDRLRPSDLSKKSKKK